MTPIPTASPPIQRVAMMPAKKTAAIDARIHAVLRFDARRRCAGSDARVACGARAAGVHQPTSGRGRAIRGGVSNVWYGAGDGTVHSRVSAPSHGFAGALGPMPRAHWIIE